MWRPLYILALLVLLGAAAPAFATESCAGGYAHFQAPLTAAEKQLLARFPAMMKQLLDGDLHDPAALRAQMLATAALARKGTVPVQVPEELMSKIKPPARPDPTKPLDSSHFARYGQEKNPIFAYKIFGKEGTPGGVYIYTPGESVGPTEFARFLGPPHRHKGEAHISLVTQGEGIFYIQIGEKLVGVPVKRGTAVLIPPDAVHTFYAGNNGPFDVASFTTSFLPTNSPAFQEMVSPAELEKLLPAVPYQAP